VFEIGGLVRTGRVDQVEPELWIVGNDPECFNDIRFIEKTAEKMAELLRPYKVDCLFAPVTRAMMIAFKTAELLGHRQIAIARKSISPAPPEVLRVGMTSITSGREGELMIDGETKDIIKGGRVALFDDVISRGDTMKGLMELARRAKAKVVAVSAVGIEGAAPYSVFEKEFRQDKLVYLAVLPLFARGQTYDDLMEEKRQVEEIFRN
jgi:adenine/guanine phosphoribosyltransferase-like PRPP-binding protein